MQYRPLVLKNGKITVLPLNDSIDGLPSAQSPLFWTTIVESESVTVPVNRLLLYVSPLIVRGNLMVSGLLKEV